jgi:F420-dependent oxidoreductase-like protein
MAPSRPIRVGIKIPPQQIAAPDLRASWRLAEAAGFDHYWTYDHLAGVVTAREDSIFEPWTLLAAAAVATSIRLGVVVTANTFRHPAVLAKMVTTVDHLSGGRVEFGIGAGWEAYEHAMLALPYGTMGERLRRLDESLTVIRSLWTEPETSFAGSFYRVQRAVAEPKPVQRPHPPIWVGAAGDRLGLRVVARHADVWNLIAGAGGVDSPAAARRKGDVLAEHCAVAGRDPAAIRRSLSWYYAGGAPEAGVEEIRTYLELGFTEVILNVRPGRALADADRLAAVMLPALRLTGAA